MDRITAEQFIERAEALFWKYYDYIGINDADFPGSTEEACEYCEAMRRLLCEYYGCSGHRWCDRCGRPIERAHAETSRS